MTLAKLFILGQEIELLWTDMNYYRDTRINGKPASDTNGGLITLCYATDRYSDLVLHWMTKKNEDETWNEVDKMERGKVCFYENGFEYPPTKTYKFEDTHLIYFREIFFAEGTQLMQTILTISPAIQNYGADLVKLWNHNWKPPQEYQTPVYSYKQEEKDFEISIKHLTNKSSFVPLGIPSFKGIAENKYIEFEIEVKKNDIDDFDIEILHNNSIIQNYHSSKQTLDEVVITAKGSSNNSEANNEQSAQKNYPVGKYNFKWDGFDSNDIYDSTIFTSGKLKARIKARQDGKEKTAESSEFTFAYKEVDWVDTKIDRSIKRIDVTLRVNLRDGGEKGTEKDCYETGSGSYAPITKHCPWDKIPEKDIKRSGKTPIQKRDKNNNSEALKQLALDGIKKYWSRHSGNIGKGVFINKELYEVYISCKQDEQGMIAPEIIYFTNSENGTFNRSHNWFASRKLFYKEGYLKSDGWDYRSSSVAIKYFEETAAHEIGHQLLVQLEGEYHSYTHKGTSHPSVIIQDPVKGTRYPTDGKEIDLMKYADDSYPYDYYKRVILSKKDLLGLLWLTKLEVN